jgi:hypothetical protein
MFWSSESRPGRKIYDAAEQAEQQIGFRVNVTLSSPARWAAASDALIQQIRSSPVV